MVNSQRGALSAELTITNLVSNEALVGYEIGFATYHFVSNAGSWNNCFIKFSTSDNAFLIHLFVCCAAETEGNDQWRLLWTIDELL